MTRIITLLLAFFLVSNTFAQKKNILSKHDIKVQKIILSEKAVIRGIDFYITKDVLKKLEKAKLEAETKSSLIYKVDVGDGDYADIIYQIDDKNKVSGFTIAFILKNKSQEDNLMTDLKNYYTERYGDFFTDDKGDVFWISKEDYKIEMSDSSSDGQTEIEIEYISSK